MREGSGTAGFSETKMWKAAVCLELVGNVGVCVCGGGAG